MVFEQYPPGNGTWKSTKILLLGSPASTSPAMGFTSFRQPGFEYPVHCESALHGAPTPPPSATAGLSFELHELNATTTAAESSPPIEGIDMVSLFVLCARRNQ
jgi:hypothetical protein